jgi:hypothetical protein
MAVAFSTEFKSTIKCEKIMHWIGDSFMTIRPLQKLLIVKDV